jgi:hypothetical protein
MRFKKIKINEILFVVTFDVLYIYIYIYPFWHNMCILCLASILKKDLREGQFVYTKPTRNTNN